ncbi:hypothetical protein OA002_00485 [bacterium]|nr:hypothetical protein [bacterium]
MADQLESNLPFEDRTQEIQNEILALLNIIGKDESELLEVYESLNWGSLSNSVFYSALLKMKKQEQLMSADQVLSFRNRIPNRPSGVPSTHEDIEEVSETWVRRRQPVITKDLIWFINNGETDEIRNKAREYRERVLLDLYTEHVRMTGETYFPELHRLLKAEWDFSFTGEE